MYLHLFTFNMYDIYIESKVGYIIRPAVATAAPAYPDTDTYIKKQLLCSTHPKTHRPPLLLASKLRREF